MTDDESPKRTGIREIWGIVLLIFSALMALALISYQPDDIPFLKVPPSDPPLNYVGPAGGWFGFISLMTLGVGALFLPLWFGILGLLLLFRPQDVVWERFVWGAVVVLALSSLVALHPQGWSFIAYRFNIDGLCGGLFGSLVADKGFAGIFGSAGATVVASGFLIGGLVLSIGKKNLIIFFHWLFLSASSLKSAIDSSAPSSPSRLNTIEREERALSRQREQLEKSVRREIRTAPRAAPPPSPAPTPASIRDRTRDAKPEPVSAPSADPLPTPKLTPVITQSVVVKTAPARKPEKPIDAPSTASTATPPSVPPAQPAYGNYQLPGLSLLNPIPPEGERKIQGDIEITARILRETLAEFDIECEVKNAEQGPVVTRYEILPAPGVRVEKITQLSNNLALALKAVSVRVQAPIPGKGLVGIEVPNDTATKVTIRELLESPTWQNSKAAIPLVLGKDVGGNDVVMDLASMPHLLIAGATGSGKTVCMNSILAGMLMSRTPHQLKLMLVDPKIVEFAAYNHLPHLVVPVITDPKKVPLGLRWAIKEMEKRYKMFARAGVRNIQGFNNRKKIEPVQVDAEPLLIPLPDEDPLPDTVPYIVIVIDELADLMMVAQAEVENSIARLAQLSRATGIHLILATQRPSVNVITGTIKANIPGRISFQVAQKTDSRTILDQNGADKLLGRGDMLILPPGSGKLIRAQGALTTDDEINSIVEFIKKQAAPAYETAIKETIENKTMDDMDEGEEDDGADEDLIEQSIEIIRQTKRASVSILQRRMKIGYNRAGRLMDRLEERGIVGPANGSNPRDILIDLDGEIPSNEPLPEEKPMSVG